MAASAGGGVPNAGLITASIMAAALMQTLDTTIANVALPHIQGSVSASQDQITWVLTFYIVAAAIMTPMTGWLSERIGRKTLMLISIAGFTAASALCGAAGSLGQIVLFRFLQGIAGAALMPLAQATLLDINPPERFGQAMATFAMAVVLGPILGPTLGGWLTQNYSWRWVFFINVPVGVLAFLGTWLFMPQNRTHTPPKFDFLGFGSLAVGVAALQLMLDRGETKDWFGSPEIMIECGVAALCLYVFLVHSLTARAPLFSRQMFKDRNFATTQVATVFIMGVMYGSLALVPPMLQTLYGYPVFSAGLILMARGLGAFASMTIVGRLVGRFDPRLLMGVGLLLFALSCYIMMQFSPVMGGTPFVISGVVQGLAMGFIWVPLSTLSFATLPGAFRTQASTVANLLRNVGGSIGISLLQVLLVKNVQVAHADMAGHIRPDNPAVQRFLHGQPMTGEALKSINGLISNQAAFIAYIDDFYLMALLMLGLLPMLLIMRAPPRGAAPAPAAME